MKRCQFCTASNDADQWRDCWLHGPRKVCPNCGDCAGPVAHGPGFATEPQP